MLRFGGWVLRVDRGQVGVATSYAAAVRSSKTFQRSVHVERSTRLGGQGCFV